MLVNALVLEPTKVAEDMKRFLPLTNPCASKDSCKQTLENIEKALHYEPTASEKKAEELGDLALYLEEARDRLTDAISLIYDRANNSGDSIWAAHGGFTPRLPADVALYLNQVQEKINEFKEATKDVIFSTYTV